MTSARHARGWLTGALLVLLAAVPTVTRAQSTPRYILVLTSFEQQFSPHNVFNAAFRAELTQRSSEPIQFIDVALPPTSPVRSRREPAATLEYLRTTFAIHQPDLVVTVGGLAAMFVQQHRDSLFPKAPILFASVDQRFVQNNALRENETAVPVSIDTRMIIENILQVLPNTKTLAIVIGASQLEAAWRADLARTFAPYAKRVKLLWFHELSFAEMLKQAASLPPDTAILLAHLGVDAHGIPQVEERGLAQLRAVANAPIFGVFQSQLGQGIVGGPVIDVNVVGITTAEIATRILNGESPRGLMPPPQKLGAPAYDSKELERWNIAESRLPPGSTVHFRAPSAWERYRTQIVTALSIGVVETALLAAMVTLYVKRRRSERLREESESRFSLLADTAPVMIWTADASGNATDVNRAWLDFTGREKPQELGNGWTQSIHPDDRSGCLETCRNAIARRDPFRVEYRLRRADGEYRWILQAGAPRFTTDNVCVGYTGSAVDITEHRLAAATLATLSRRLIQAQEQERTRIARELHDDVCQRLAAFSMQLAQLMQHLPKDDGHGRRAVAELSRKSKDLSNDIQALSHRLHSSRLQLLGLAGASSSFCRELSARHGITVNFTHQDVPAQLPEETSVGLFRVMQEALMNGLKHSGAQTFDVRLNGNNGSLHLDVVDRGVGFIADDPDNHNGLGLVSMRERLNLIGGELFVRSHPGQGTTVSARVPVQALTPETETVQRRKVKSVPT